MSARRWLAIAAANGFIGVAAGAFAAHALKQSLSSDLLEVFKTGAQYQLIHALALGLAALTPENKPIRLARWLFLGGIVLFSGSLYALALSGMHKLGIITPFGGVAFLAGWAMLAAGALKRGE
ncbi:uncharacterized membrane protein YgdD (TMEM256/DUF423 family) [Rhizomicrobium palustre]|uniref:Uncharacterized membrane protein YgdD (TMEM256/DUF423 family) n=1 Tax=Rhizomicrobium palustre TaxID=189966 RepID=A0A846MVW5_9PROT|nr:DUF423 domain-containing protein [Rhizomicrobium palustre]NIK87365.1 uncharacterized membrane protein YgdD (TMEM256/DUF423 family) [Rhizomicrobium palustre]